MAKPRKRAKDIGLMLGLFIVLAAAVVLAVQYLITPSGIPQVPGSTGTTGVTSIWNCADMQIDVTWTKEASAYFKYGIQRNAPPDYVFQMLSMTVTNKASTTQDFSGYRVLLSAGGNAYIPIIFSSIDKIIPVDSSETDYGCKELALASVSRLVLDPGQSSSGCKIFQVPQGARPASLQIHDPNGLKCTILL